MKLFFNVTIGLCFAIYTTAAPIKQPVKKPEPIPAKVEINPQYLRTRLLTNNLGILKGLNNVYQTKFDVNLKRSQLLPSINLGAALNSQGGGFFLSSVSFLLPFLIPTNWFNYKESKYIFEAEKFSYYLTKLNTYASAYSTVVTVSADLELKKVLEQQYKNLVKIQEMIQLRYDFGLVTDTDLSRTKAQTQLAFIQLSQMEQLIVKEIASLRLLLSLPLETEIQIANFKTIDSDIEALPTAEVLQKALAKSPEYAQVLNLISASKEGKWSRAFAFLNGASLSTNGTGNQTTAFNQVTASAQFNFGFGLFPAYKMSQLAIAQLELRKKEIQLELTQMIESNLGVIAMAKAQLDNAIKAEALLNKTLEDQIANYSLGLTDLLHVLDVQNSIVQASTARVQSQNDLNHLRINLHRLMLTDEFQKIEPCKAKLQNASFWIEIKDFFFSTESQKKVEQICLGGTGT